MSVLCCCGSIRASSSNYRLLQSIQHSFPQYEWRYFPLGRLPMFQPELDQAPWPEPVLSWRQEVERAKAVIVSTPAYLENIPAAVKNALEWLTTSGELAGKPVLPITFSPHPPRGQTAMQSMCWSLQALEARIIGQLPLYQNELELKQDRYHFDQDHRLLLAESLKLLVGEG